MNRQILGFTAATVLALCGSLVGCSGTSRFGVSGSAGDSGAPSAGSSGGELGSGAAGTGDAQAGSSGTAGDGGAAGDGGSAGEQAQAALTTIHVMDVYDHHLVEGASVFIHGADGSLVSETRTDPNGTAEIELVEGQSVSAVRLRGYTVDGTAYQSRWFSTAFGVPPGGTVELLVLDPANYSVTPPPPAPMTVTVELSTALEDADQDRIIRLSCGGDQYTRDASYTFKTFTGCPGKDTFDVYGVVLKGGVPAAFAAKYDVPFRPTRSVTIQLDANDTNISSAKLKAGPIPAGSELLDFQVFASRNKQGADRYSDSVIARPPGVAETLTARLPMADFAEYRTLGVLQVATSPFYLESRFSRAEPALVPHDWAPVDDIAMFQPHIDNDPSDISRPRISWDLAATGKLGDALGAIVTWGVGSDQTYWYTWDQAARSGSVQLPVLPEKFSALRPKPGDTFSYGLSHLDLTDVRSYADFIARHVELGTDNANWAVLSN